MAIDQIEDRLEILNHLLADASTPFWLWSMYLAEARHLSRQWQVSHV
jgi:hypothetical protein